MMTEFQAYRDTLKNCIMRAADLPEADELATHQADGRVFGSTLALGALGRPEHLEDLVVALRQFDQARLLPVWVDL